MADLKPELISVLRDIRDIKYPDIVDKHDVVVAKEALVNPHYTNIDAIGGSIASINTNATNIANINANATNIVAIQNASANAISALASKNSADADVVLTHADVVKTNADVVTTTAKALIASQVLAMTATASTLVSGSLASASYNPTTGIMSLGIPTGPKGDKGDAFVINALGTFTGRSAYNLQPINFTYYATDIGEIYFKLSATSGDWSVGSPFGKGDTGDTGNGIASITKTGSVANVDTYRILYTDATFFDFNVTNGSVTSVAGRTGAITLTKTDVGLSNVDNTSDLLKPLSTAEINALVLKANLASPTFTGTVVLPSTTSIGTITNTELSYLDGVTSAIQTQLNAKANLASPALTGTPTAPTPTAGDNTTKVATTAFVKAKSELDSIGVNQTWQNVTASRNFSITYTNSTGKPIMVSINHRSNLSDATIYVDGAIFCTPRSTDANDKIQNTFVVKDGGTYSMIGGGSIYYWMELR